MARKQFVSSKKSAPIASSKEAALRGRGHNMTETNGTSDNELNSNLSSDAENRSLSSSDEEESENEVQTSDDENGINSDTILDNSEEDNDIENNDTTGPIEVEVLPSQRMGGGKQLRYPSSFVRGKESRVPHLTRESIGNSESSMSESEDIEDEDGEIDDNEHVKTVNGMSPSTSSQSQISPVPAYPIKSARARKRYRPDDEYYKKMSTYVRECLLSVRKSEENTDVKTEIFEPLAHQVFRQNLLSGKVERVEWTKDNPDENPQETENSTQDATKSKEQVSRKRPREDVVSTSKDELSSSNAKSIKHSSSSSKRSRDKDRDRSKEHKRSKSKKKKRDSSSQHHSGHEEKRSIEENKKVENSENHHGVKTEVKQKSAPAISKLSDTNSQKDDLRKETTVKTDDQKLIDSTKPCSECEKRRQEDALMKIKQEKKSDELSKIKKEEKPVDEKDVKVVVQVEKKSVVCNFEISSISNEMNVNTLKIQAQQLADRARALKHEGDAALNKPKSSENPQVTQGRLYLQSSIKFFQNAMAYGDLKVAYRSQDDEIQARKYSDYCLKTLAQTSTLIESSIRMIHAGGHKELLAIAYKIAAILHLTMYRLQHAKLYHLYADAMVTPSRSPDVNTNTNQRNLTTPPLHPEQPLQSAPTSNPPQSNGNAASSQINALKTHLLKEMEHHLRGWELWRRFEACEVSVLQEVQSPMLVDLPKLFIALELEFQREKETKLKNESGHR